MATFFRPAVAHGALLALALLLAGTSTLAGQASKRVPDGPGRARPVHVTTPRIAPLPESQWTDVHKRLVEKYAENGRPGNGFRTLLNLPALVDGTSPFEVYINNASSLSPRDRELLILRTAWLLNNDYVWAEHAPKAAAAGLTGADLHRIAEGPDAKWESFEATLLHAADELFVNAYLGEQTWNALAAKYDSRHLVDAVMTVCEFTSLSLIYNSLGVQPDAGSAARIPADVPYRITVPARQAALKVPRVAPLPGNGLAITRTFAQFPDLAAPRSTGSNYVNQKSNLMPRHRELLILRTGWDCQSEYEWAQHVGSVGRGRAMGLPIDLITKGPAAPGWDPFEALLLTAADELYRDSVISDQTWKALAPAFDDEKRINAVVTASNYRMVSIALNALGVQIDPGDEGFPVN